MFLPVPAGNYAGRNNRKAQSTLELALIFILIAVALMSMSVFIKRAVQGRIRSAADDIGEQYSPALVDSEITTQTDSRTESNVTVEQESSIDAASRTTTTTQETTTRQGQERLGEYKDEPFFF